MLDSACFKSNLRLHSLDLAFNLISAISSDVQKNLKGLAVLHLEFNRLRDFPIAQGHLPALRELSLQGNLIRSVPAWLRDTKLDHLSWELAVMGKLEEVESFGRPL